MRFVRRHSFLLSPVLQLLKSWELGNRSEENLDRALRLAERY